MPPSCSMLMVISIHALHEESDSGGTFSYYGFGISIHALHEESDQVYRQCSHE